MFKQLTKDITINENDRYLELGASNGYLAKYLCIKNELYFQVDINYPNKLESQSFSDRYIVGDIQLLPIKERSIDYIFITCVLHHLENPLKVLESLKGKLRKVETNAGKGNKSQIYILIPNDPSFQYKLLYKIFSAKHLKRIGVKDPWEHHLNQHLVRKDALHYFVKKTFINSKISVRNYPTILPVFRIYKITL
jgi:SAM-dependent methyltransferase